MKVLKSSRMKLSWSRQKTVMFEKWTERHSSHVTELNWFTKGQPCVKLSYIACGRAIEETDSAALLSQVQFGGFALVQFHRKSTSHILKQMRVRNRDFQKYLVIYS